MGTLLSKKSDSLCDLKILVGPSIPVSPPLILNETSSSIDTKANCACCQDLLSQPVWYLLKELKEYKSSSPWVESPKSKVTMTQQPF